MLDAAPATTAPVDAVARPTESIHNRRLSTDKPVCPLKGHITLVNRTTGEVGRGACERLTCPVCRPAAAMRQAKAIAAAEPDLFVTLTLVGEDWPTTRRRINRFRANLRRHYPTWQDCASVEVNKRGTGRHAHLYAHLSGAASSIDYLVFQEAAVRAGMGPVIDVSYFEMADGARALPYALKAAMRPPGSGDAGDEFLGINGGRLLHSTRGFFRAGRGGAPRTLAAAVKAAR